MAPTPDTGKKFDLAAVPPDQAPVFSVSPDRIVLGPKEAITTTISMLAVKPGQVGGRLGCLGDGGAAALRFAEHAYLQVIAVNHPSQNKHHQKQVQEQLICTAQLTTGASSRAVRRVFEVEMRADVAAPLLEWSKRGLEFSYVHAPGLQPDVQTRPLEMRWGLQCLGGWGRKCLRRVEIEIPVCACVRV